MMSRMKQAVILGSVFVIGGVMLCGCTPKNAKTLNGTYKMEGVICVEIGFRDDGTADYGYPGIYSRTDDEEGNKYMHLAYGYPSDASKVGIKTYTLAADGDKVSLYRLNSDDEGKEGGESIYDLTFTEGTDGIRECKPFDGTYISDDGLTYHFKEDSTYSEYNELEYKMDDEQLTLGSGDSKSVYNYTLSDDEKVLTLTNESGSKEWEFNLVEE